MRTLLAFLLFCSTAVAQTRTAQIAGPTTAPSGTLVELRATSDVSSAMTWLTVSDVQYRTYESGNVLVFATPKAGKYEFALVVVVVTADGKPVVSIEKHSVEITSTPGPQPGPTPEPIPPDPVSPYASLTKLGAVAPATNRSEVKAVYRTVATMVVAGTIATAEQLKSETSQRNRPIVGDASDPANAWNKFAMTLSNELKTLESAGKLATKEQWAAAWNAIAEGL